MALIKCYPQPRPESQMKQFLENTSQEPQKPKKVKDWKYYVKLIAGILCGMIIGKLIAYWLMH